MIDFESLKSKLNSLNKQTSKTNSSEGNLFWKPSGNHVIRILPYLHDRSNPFLEMYFYYDLSDKIITSPVSYGNDDPVLEFAKKLQSKGNKEDWRMGKDMEPKRRVHAMILVRGLEHEGPKLWGFSDTVYREILGTMLDPDYGDITDLKTGRDVAVVYTPAANGEYPKTSTRVKPNQTMATDDPKVMELIENMPVRENIFKAPSYDELKDMLLEYLKLKQDSKVDAVVDQPEEIKKVPSTKSAVDAFDKLFG